MRRGFRIRGDFASFKGSQDSHKTYLAKHSANSAYYRLLVYSCLTIKYFSEILFNERNCITLRCLTKGIIKTKEYETYKETTCKKFSEAAMCFCE